MNEIAQWVARSADSKERLSSLPSLLRYDDGLGSNLSPTTTGCRKPRRWLGQNGQEYWRYGRTNPTVRKPAAGWVRMVKNIGVMGELTLLFVNPAAGWVRMVKNIGVMGELTLLFVNPPLVGSEWSRILALWEN